MFRTLAPWPATLLLAMNASAEQVERYDYWQPQRVMIRHGQQALMMCNGLFTSRRTLEQIFAQELAALLKAGLPLLQSLDVMLERQKDPLLRQSLGSVREKVKSGTALSDAFRAEGDLYPPIFAASLVAGERSGNLDSVLRRFAQHLRLNQALRKKAISAAVYPAVLLIMMAGLLALMLLFVIPNFQSFFEGLNAELPLAGPRDHPERDQNRQRLDRNRF